MKATSIFEKVSLSLLLFSALALASCGSKDSNFSDRYKNNMSGANAISAQTAAVAAQFANANGNNIDVRSFQGPFSSGSYTQVTATIVVNNASIPITTTLAPNGSGFTPVNGKTTISGLEFEVDAACFGSACSRYYLMLTVRKAGAVIIQEGFRKILLSDELYTTDTYQFFSPEQYTNFANMMNVLNSQN